MPARKKKKKKWLFAFLLLLPIIVALRFIPVRPDWPKSQPFHPDCRGQVEREWQEDSFDVVAKLISCDTLEQINRRFVSEVKPIFAQKCLMCHGQTETVPLYAVVPPISFLVHHDVKEGRKHLDMSFDFPFKGHHTQEEILEDIREVTGENSMPPWYYTLAHWRSGLSAEEKKIVLSWVTESLAKLK